MKNNSSEMQKDIVQTEKIRKMHDTSEKILKSLLSKSIKNLKDKNENK